MKIRAPNCCVTGSHASVQMKLRPKSWIAGHARSKTLNAIHPSSTVAASAAAIAIPLKATSPRRMPRRRRSLSGAVDSYVVDVMPGGCLLRPRLDLLDLAVDEAVHGLRQRHEEERRPELLAGGHRPVDELPQVGRLVARVGRDD